MTDDISEKVKITIQALLPILQARADQSTEVLNITDVLAQVYLKIDTVKAPEALVNRLINYIRSESLKGKIYFPPAQERYLLDLSEIGKKAGLNGLNIGDFSDKSQFYSYTEPMPRR